MFHSVIALQTYSIISIMVLLKQQQKGSEAMTKEETKQFNIRIAESLYNEIRTEADKQEITMTEYVISKLTDDSNHIDDSYKERYIEQLNTQLQQQADAIQSKDKHIQGLTRLVDQQQQLTLATQKANKQLQLDLDEQDTNKKWWQIWK